MIIFCVFRVATAVESRDIPRQQLFSIGHVLAEQSEHRILWAVAEADYTHRYSF